MTARRFAVVAALAAITAAVVAAPGSTSAHSLASSSVTIELTAQDMTGEVSLAVASLDEAFAADRRSDVLSEEAYAAQVISYLDDHLIVAGIDGTVWQESYSDLRRQTVEGIETIDVDLEFEVTAGDPSQFTIVYDAIIGADADHEAVLVLIDADNRVSTPGMFTDDDTSIDVGWGTSDAGLGATLGRLWPALLGVALVLAAGIALGARGQVGARADVRSRRRARSIGAPNHLPRKPARRIG